MLPRAFIRGVASSRALSSTTIPKNFRTASSLSLRPPQTIAAASCPQSRSRAARLYSSATDTTADEIVEELQELYATAKDEFEIAQEETEKVSVYAQDDRQAAREELDKLEAAYKAAVEDTTAEVGQEVQRRVGARIRELKAAVENMEELAQNQD